MSVTNTKDNIISTVLKEKKITIQDLKNRTTISDIHYYPTEPPTDDYLCEHIE